MNHNDEKLSPIFDPEQNPLEKEFQEFLKADNTADTPETRHAFFSGTASGLCTGLKLCTEGGVSLDDTHHRSFARLTVVAAFGTRAYTRTQLMAIVRETEQRFPSNRTEI